MEVMMKRSTLATGAMLSLLILTPCAASAQPDQPRVSVGAGAGLAIPFHGDFDFTPWAWDADLRVAVSPHLLIEAAVGEWRHSESRVSEAIRVATPPGTIGRLEQTTGRVQRIYQANALFTAGAGRIRATAGGGVGLLQHDRQTRTTTSGCSPGVTCGSFESAFSSATGSVQAVGGVEVRIAGGIALYGQTRFVVPMTDPGGSDLRVTAGARVGFGS
jgi:hypothetical protein